MRVYVEVAVAFPCRCGFSLCLVLIYDDAATLHGGEGFREGSCEDPVAVLYQKPCMCDSVPSEETIRSVSGSRARSTPRF